MLVQNQKHFKVLWRCCAYTIQISLAVQWVAAVAAAVFWKQWRINVFQVWAAERTSRTSFIAAGAKLRMNSYIQVICRLFVTFFWIFAPLSVRPPTEKKKDGGEEKTGIGNVGLSVYICIYVVPAVCTKTIHLFTSLLSFWRTWLAHIFLSVCPSSSWVLLFLKIRYLYP